MADNINYTESDILSAIKNREREKQKSRLQRQGVPREVFDEFERETVARGGQTEDQLAEIARRQARQRSKQEDLYIRMADELNTQRSYSSGERPFVEVPDITNTERLAGVQPNRKKTEYLDIDPTFNEETGELTGVSINDIKFGKSLSVDGSGKLVFSPENESRLRISTDLLEGVKVYMAKEYANPNFIEMPRQQFITYAVLRLLPYPVRLAITEALEKSDPNTLKIINDVMKDEPVAPGERNVTIEDVLCDQLEESKRMNRLLEGIKKNQDEDMPAMLYALSWLLMDRMDLREHLQKQTFEQALQEDGIYDNKEALIREGKHMKKREKTINNDNFR